MKRYSYLRDGRRHQCPFRQPAALQDHACFTQIAEELAVHY